jgi:hypothetical protein
VLDLDLAWLCARGSALRAAEERVALRPQIQALSAELESLRQRTADVEARLAHAVHHDAELAAAALNLEDPSPEELVFAELLL